MKPVTPVTIVVLSKYFEVFDKFYQSWHKYANRFPVVVVVDGKEDLERWKADDKFTVIPGPDKFSMAGNGNLGLNAVPAGRDILYCGDDVRFLSIETIESLQKIAYSDSKIGLLSPKIIGRGSPMQVEPENYLNGSTCLAPPLQMWFPCIYIKRELIDKIGVLDERFNDFGSDDVDYCIRTIKAGYKLVITPKVAVEHEASQEGGPTTFCKKIGAVEWQRQEKESRQKLAEKWNVDDAALNFALVTGDVRKLSEVPVAPATTTFAQSQKEYLLKQLQSHSIYIATPAYGGWLAINYVNSLISLINLCHNWGVKYTTSFLYNESLITRARNKMVDEYLHKSQCTDFFFIDADIGFDSRDIMNLLICEEEVISAPCPRKNLRLDRVFDVGKENHRAYSIEDLQKLCGEFVLNFPVNAVPSAIDLGKTLEVEDAGTGLMKIKREVFKKFEEAYPDRWYMPLRGEGDDKDHNRPMYMYFQAGLDQESAKTSANGYPVYLSEDYAFCRDARRAGMKVWIAPWMKTTHTGTYMFHGDMEAVAKAGGRLR